MAFRRSVLSHIMEWLTLLIVPGISSSILVKSPWAPSSS